MGFGEEFHGMSDREILVEVAVKQRIMEAKLDTIQCPSPKCQLHDRRLSNVEDQLDDIRSIEKEEQENRTAFWNRWNVSITLLCVIIATAAAVWALMQ